MIVARSLMRCFVHLDCSSDGIKQRKDVGCTSDEKNYNEPKDLITCI